MLLRQFGIKEKKRRDLVEELRNRNNRQQVELERQGQIIHDGERARNALADDLRDRDEQMGNLVDRNEDLDNRLNDLQNRNAAQDAQIQQLRNNARNQAPRRNNRPSSIARIHPNNL
ncbi:unnamed protein product [Caenorhabditis angaria]|uniref:Uncharacterized protein n=1 Tax=Caenorhabditis angaria TaxID=860376 RepID=A0A9P1IAR4_9PELO|nr:unnamed protein product [Caenorhabditis angaria]